MDSRGVTAYPTNVAGEFETLKALGKGRSLARFGDGELKMMYGSAYAREPANPKLATELFNTLNRPPKNLLVGIPTLDPNGPKYANWIRHKERFERCVHGAFQYYSAFVTRPDSAPWIETDEYLSMVLALWQGKRALLLSEPDNKLVKLMQETAGEFIHREVPSHECYRKIDHFEEMAVGLQPDVAVLSVGPTATCLASRLAGHGIQALDLGSIGGMLARLKERRHAPP